MKLNGTTAVLQSAPLPKEVKAKTLEAWVCLANLNQRGGGVISLLAYGAIIWAMQESAMGAVSALRETSVVFAALLGAIFLRERLTGWRIGACCIIAAGAACVGWRF